MSHPHVSIVIPFYNGEEHLSDTLDSILNQTFTDFELLLINDGSPQTSQSFFDSIEQRDSRIQIHHKPNGGVACARQFGISKAKSELIAFCDQDDLWLPTKLEKQIPLFENKEVGLVFCGAIEDHITEDRKVELPFYNSFRGNIFESLLQRNEIVSCTAVARKALLVKTNAFDKDRGLMGVDDWLAWLKLSLVCQVDFVEEYLALHVFHGSNYSSNEWSMYRAEKVCLEKIKEFAIIYPQNNTIDYTKVELNIHLRYAESLIYTGDFNNGASALHCANRLSFSTKRLVKFLLLKMIPNSVLLRLQGLKRK